MFWRGRRECAVFSKRMDERRRLGSVVGAEGIFLFSRGDLDEHCVCVLRISSALDEPRGSEAMLLFLVCMYVCIELDHILGFSITLISWK